MKPRLHLTGASAREWGILAGLLVLTLVLLYPLSLNPNDMVPEPADPLLNVWRMHWGRYALLSGPDGLRQLFDANIFYPYPMTLAYSEHFLMETALALPFLLVASSHLLGMNLSVLLSFVLSAYAMYLLISDWTKNRWAGFFAGFLLAFAPFRFGQINHLELLVMQWMPLTLLSLHWLLTRARRCYLVLFILFFNFQALSAINYTLHLALACLLLAIAYGLAGRVRWRWSLLAGLAIFGGITLVVNWPLWRVYLRFSEVMNAERSLGDVRVYSAALTDYLTTIPHNLLYGWTFGRWQPPGHQFQPLMPVAVIGFSLALTGLAWSLWGLARRRLEAVFGLFLAVLTLVAFVLSLGTNNEAFGSTFAPALARWLPYAWLYEHLPGLKGIRVPARFAVLVTLGLVGLAGWGLAFWQRFLRQRQSRKAGRQQRRLSLALAPVLMLLASLEYWSVPLAGPRFAYGEAIPPVYAWLRGTPGDAVVLELPHTGASEFTYEYFSTYHWRKLVNGGTGYTPPAHKLMRDWFETFPDWRSVDVIQQLGVDYVVFHQSESAPDDWQAVRSQLPGFLPAFDQIHQVGRSVVLHVAEPQCRLDAAAMSASLSLDTGRQPATATLTLGNEGPATFVADVARTSYLSAAGHRVRDFFEPLVVLPNTTGIVQMQLGAPADEGQLEAWLATLDRSVVSGMSSAAPLPLLDTDESPDQALALGFQNGPQLIGFSVVPEEPRVCGWMNVTLYWQAGIPGEIVVLQLVDRFARVVMESQSQPWDGALGKVRDSHRLPLPGTLPPGAYGLRVKVRTPSGDDRAVMSDAGDVISADRLPLWPVILRPLPAPVPEGGLPLGTFGEAIELLGSNLSQQGEMQPGDWLRFTLIWRAQRPVGRDLTVFTQLIGPDGRTWGQQDNPPHGGWYPTPLWQPGEVVRDDFAFALDPLAPAGSYQLVVGLYDSQTIQRLPVRTADGSQADYFSVGQVTVR